VRKRVEPVLFFERARPSGPARAWFIRMVVTRSCTVQCNNVVIQKHGVQSRSGISENPNPIGIGMLVRVKSIVERSISQHLEKSRSSG